MWLCCLAQIGTNMGWVFLVTWLPKYLEEVHQIPEFERGVMASLPMLAGTLGMLYGGVLTDRLTKALGLRWGRALPMGLSRFIGMVAYLICLLPLAEWAGPKITPWLMTCAFCVVAFSTDLGVGAVWAYNQDVGGRYIGAVLGWGNMWGNVGAALTPPLMIYVIGERIGSQPRDWNMAFVIAAVGFLVAGLAGLGVDATRPIAEVPKSKLE
jgi:nitrate/nitrite transporter NarK